MKKPSRFIKIISSILCFTFLFTQSGIAQLLPQLTPTLPQPLPLLRYLSVNQANPSNYFNFLLDKGLSPQGTDPETKHGALPDLNSEAKKLIYYFFLGITLPSESFWVNLKPAEPERITSTELSKTDLGRTLLEQDLQLKKDVAKYLHPHNPQGKQYWERLYSTIGKDKAKKAIITTSNRVWITPDEAVVLETEDGALVAKASLKVLLESEYLSLKEKRWNKEVEAKAEVKDEIKNISENLMKEIILPAITQDINASPAYAPLRQIYHSLILAEWYKRKQGLSPQGTDPKQETLPETNPYSKYINSGTTQGLESELPWEKQTIWQEYLKSYQEGEYKLQDTLFGLKRMYWSGGITFFGGGGTGVSGGSPIVVERLLEPPRDNAGEVLVTTTGTGPDNTKTEVISFGNKEPERKKEAPPTDNTFTSSISQSQKEGASLPEKKEKSTFPAGGGLSEADLERFPMPHDAEERLNTLFTKGMHPLERQLILSFLNGCTTFHRIVMNKVREGNVKAAKKFIDPQITYQREKMEKFGTSFFFDEQSKAIDFLSNYIGWVLPFELSGDSEEGSTYLQEIQNIYTPYLNEEFRQKIIEIAKSGVTDFVRTGKIYPTKKELEDLRLKIEIAYYKTTKDLLVHTTLESISPRVAEYLGVRGIPIPVVIVEDPLLFLQIVSYMPDGEAAFVSKEFLQNISRNKTEGAALMQMLNELFGSYDYGIFIRRRTLNNPSPESPNYVLEGVLAHEATHYRQWLGEGESFFYNHEEEYKKNGYLGSSYERRAFEAQVEYLRTVGAPEEMVSGIEELLKRGEKASSPLEQTALTKEPASSPVINKSHPELGPYRYDPTGDQYLEKDGGLSDYVYGPDYLPGFFLGDRVTNPTKSVEEMIGLLTPSDPFAKRFSVHSAIQNFKASGLEVEPRNLNVDLQLQKRIEQMLTERFINEETIVIISHGHFIAGTVPFIEAKDREGRYRFDVAIHFSLGKWPPAFNRAKVALAQQYQLWSEAFRERRESEQQSAKGKVIALFGHRGYPNLFGDQGTANIDPYGLFGAPEDFHRFLKENNLKKIVIITEEATVGPSRIYEIPLLRLKEGDFGENNTDLYEYMKELSRLLPIQVVTGDMRPPVGALAKELGEEDMRNLIQSAGSPDVEEGKSASSAVEQKDTGGIDLSSIELTLKDQRYISSLNPADLKVLRAAKALKDEWESLSLLYIHEIMLLLKDNLIKDLQNKELLLNILNQLKLKEFLDPQALNFLQLLKSQESISSLRIAAFYP